MMSETINSVFFGWYPYFCLTVFLLGSLIRFDRDPYTWKSDSSQLLRAGQLRWGSNLFHVGVLFLFFGHSAGMLTPHFLYEPFISAGDKQLVAMVTGGVAGVLGFAVNDSGVAIPAMMIAMVVPWLIVHLFQAVSDP